MCIYFNIRDVERFLAKTENAKQSNRDKHYPNAYKTIEKGDTLRIQYEKVGDTLITHYIDIEGSGGKDKFDDTYDLKQVYTFIPCDINSKATFKMNLGKSHSDVPIIVGFDKKAVRQYCDSVITILQKDSLGMEVYENIIDRMNKGDKYLWGAVAGLKELGIRFRPALLADKTRVSAKGLLVEEYETNFSGGTNYYMINEAGDTLHIGAGTIRYN